MKRILGNIVLAFILLVAGGVCVYGQKADVPYVHGESLTYVVNYKWGALDTDVGEAVTNLEYNDGMFHSVITGYTY